MLIRSAIRWAPDRHTHGKREKPSPVMLFLLVSWPSSRCGSLTRLLSGSGWLPSWRGRHRKPSSYPWHCQISPPSTKPPDSHWCSGEAIYISPRCSASPAPGQSSRQPPWLPLPLFFSFFFGGQWGGEHWCSASPSTVASLYSTFKGMWNSSVSFFFLPVPNSQLALETAGRNSSIPGTLSAG